MPELADLGALPAAHRGVLSFGRSRMRQPILHRPEADPGAVESEGVESQGFRGGEAVGASRGAGQTFSEEVGDCLGPSDGVIAAGDSRDPQVLLLLRAGAKVIGGERMEVAAG
ncbi:MAG: hypothetical protein EXS31_07615 [Pedosphaera sp.]|nr:hypothetical protein [Pedosphaera sp.]